MRQIDEWSKFLSFVLCHKLEAVSLQLDAGGWVDINELTEKCRANGKPFTKDIHIEILTTSPKQRFALSEYARLIRANQGHAIDAELGYEQREPPSLLYHGIFHSCRHPDRGTRHE